MFSLRKRPGDLGTSLGRGVTAPEHPLALWEECVQSGQASGYIGVEVVSARLVVKPSGLRGSGSRLIFTPIFVISQFRQMT